MPLAVLLEAEEGRSGGCPLLTAAAGAASLGAANWSGPAREMLT